MSLLFRLQTPVWQRKMQWSACLWGHLCNSQVSRHPLHPIAGIARVPLNITWGVFVFVCVIPFSSVPCIRYMETPVDCMTGRPYCKINRSNGFKRCSEESLSQVYLLGRLLWMRGWVALCPQEGCGLAFLFRPGLCLYNSRGFACASCTDKIRQKERERIEGLSKISSTCALCSTNLLNSSKESYLYPHGLALCANHHSLEMLEAMHLSQLFPVESVKREMARVVTERSELKRKNIAKVNQRHLQEQRRNNRMRKQKYYY